MIPEQKRPAVLICPGGAYMNCSDREAEPVALRFNAMGYQSFVLRYSTYMEGSDELPSIDMKLEKKDRDIYPIQMQEIGRVMIMLHEHSDEWNLDPNKIILCGFSAGAHNCAMYITHWSKDIITATVDRPISYFRPAACILGYTLSDYIFMKENNEKNPFGKLFFDISNFGFLGDKDPSDDLLNEVSPARHVDEDTPPVFLWATADDNLVPVENSIILAKALAEHHIPFEMHIFENGPHGMSLADQSSAQDKTHNNPDAKKWVLLAEAWLDKRFALDLPDCQSDMPSI